jgi:L-fuculose-phosphate aldolase
MRIAMTKTERALRQSIIEHCQWMNANGLNQGTSGNISVRLGDVMLLTPSATPYETMTPDMIMTMPIVGRDHAEYGHWTGPLKPSTEWRFHLDIMHARPEINAIVHTHSPFATTLSLSRRSIPAVHYMIAVFGGTTVRCSNYARYGTTELSDYALAALKDRTACLLGNHGMITLGVSLEKAMWAAVELETLAKQYYHALLLGDAIILTDEEVLGVKSKMASDSYQAGGDRDQAAPVTTAVKATAQKKRTKAGAA